MGLGRALTPFGMGARLGALADVSPEAAVWLGERYGCGSGLTHGLCARPKVRDAPSCEGYRDVIIRVARGGATGVTLIATPAKLEANQDS